MNVILYLNNVYYRTIDIGSPIPLIYWAVPYISRPNRCWGSSGFDHNDDYYIVEFRHCGFGYYHLHVSKEEEERIRKLDKKPVNMYKSLYL